MTEINKQILELINQNASLNEMSKITGLTNKQLFYRLSKLKNQGYNLKRKYYYNGDICYELVRGIISDDNVAILTRKKDDVFKAMLVSDLHISHPNERLDLFYKLYDFCIKQGINIIINSGDLIDDLVIPNNKKFPSFDEKINYLLKMYPYDKNILNFLCLGNHDYRCLKQSGKNLTTILENKRHDIIPLGYGLGELNIKNDKIYISHPISNSSREESRKLNNIIKNSLIICGHRHTMKCSFHNNNSYIYVPSLSEMQFTDYYTIPSAIKMTLTFNNGFINSGVFEHLVFSDKVYKLSESKGYLLYDKDTSIDLEMNIDERKSVKNKSKILTP